MKYEIEKCPNCGAKLVEDKNSCKKICKSCGCEIIINIPFNPNQNSFENRINDFSKKIINTITEKINAFNKRADSFNKSNEMNSKINTKEMTRQQEYNLKLEEYRYKRLDLVVCLILGTILIIAVVILVWITAKHPGVFK